MGSSTLSVATMGSSAACLLGLLMAVFIDTMEAASLNSTSEGQLPATTARLYRFDTSTVGNIEHLNTLIFRQLKEYSVFCCQTFIDDMPPPTPADKMACIERQMAFWAWKPKSVTGWLDAIMYIDANFNPSLFDRKTAKKMCNIDVTSTTEYYPFFAMPTQMMQEATTTKYDFEDEGGDEGGRRSSHYVRHSESLLFDPMERKTKETEETLDFYLYTFNTPCYVTVEKKPPGRQSCTDHIFTHVVDFIFKGNANTWTGHTLNAGFYKWYTFGKNETAVNQAQSRDFFCKGWNLGSDNEKGKGIDGNKWVTYSQYNFKGALTFTKFAKEENWPFGEITDEHYEPGHTTDGEHC